jgi:hypothetical protein
MAASLYWSDWTAGWFDRKIEIFQITAMAGLQPQRISLNTYCHRDPQEDPATKQGTIIQKCFPGL